MPITRRTSESDWIFSAAFLIRPNSSTSYATGRSIHPRKSFPAPFLLKRIVLKPYQCKNFSTCAVTIRQTACMQFIEIQAAVWISNPQVKIFINSCHSNKSQESYGFHCWHCYKNCALRTLLQPLHQGKNLQCQLQEGLLNRTGFFQLLS